MTDLRTLAEAFTELERRADAATADAALNPTRPPRRRVPRLVPVAATVLVVAGLAAGVVWLVPGDSAAPVVGSPPTTGSTITSSPPTKPELPATPEELADRLTAVLGDTATVTVTESGPGAYQMTVPAGPPGDSAPDDVEANQGTPIGASLAGTLTAGGVTGGFDLLVLPPRNEDRGVCGSCIEKSLPDGATLWLEEMPLAGGGITYWVRLFRVDGAELDMHVSNQRSPKGASDVIAPHPPLTIDQMTEILRSELW
jgi:hypothetical protein